MRAPSLPNDTHEDPSRYIDKKMDFICPAAPQICVGEVVYSNAPYPDYMLARTLETVDDRRLQAWYVCPRRMDKEWHQRLARMGELVHTWRKGDILFGPRVTNYQEMEKGGVPWIVELWYLDRR